MLAFYTQWWKLHFDHWSFKFQDREYKEAYNNNINKLLNKEYGDSLNKFPNNVQLDSPDIESANKLDDILVSPNINIAIHESNESEKVEQESKNQNIVNNNHPIKTKNNATMVGSNITNKNISNVFASLISSLDCIYV